jgi:adenylyltransferase/sulfurtransferase
MVKIPLPRSQVGPSSRTAATHLLEKVHLGSPALREWTEEELTRFSRQIVLREVGGVGQDRLLRAKIALVGVGGIGAPAALLLAAAGIGTLRLIDHDQVELSNLHRQVLFGPDDVGRGKVEAADARLTSPDRRRA